MEDNLNIAGVLVSPSNYTTVEKILNDNDIQATVKMIDDTVDFKEFKNALMSVPLGYVIIDLDAIADLEAYATELKRYKIYGYKSSIKIILITRKPFVEPVKRAIAKSIGLGVYNIACPLTEYEEFNLEASLVIELNEKAEIRRVARWIDDVEETAGATSTEVAGKTIVKEREKIVERVKVVEKEKIVGTITIAIAGTQDKVGTTHTALSIAKFLTEQGFSTAIIETMQSKVFSTIRGLYEDAKSNRDNSFTLDSLTYYYNAETSIAEALEQDYRFLVLDMGTYQDCNLEEFKRATVRIVVSGSKDWELEGLEYILRTDVAKEKNKYLFTLATEGMFNEIKANMLNLESYRVPISPDIFNLEKELITFYKELLKQYLPQKTEQEEKVSLIENAKKIDIKGFFKKGGR